MNKKLSAIVVFLINFQLVFAPLASAQTQVGSYSNERTPAAYNDSSLNFGDEFLDKVANDKTLDLKLNLKSNDPSLDQDPFFLRSQKWGAAQPSATAFYTVGGSNKALITSKDIHPILETADYVFFAAGKSFGDFKQKVSDVGGSGEGVFFISRDEALETSIHNRPVPFYFLPLPDATWTGNVDAIDFPQFNKIVLKDNAGDILPIDIKDVEDLYALGKMNHLLASVHSLVRTPKGAAVPDLGFAPLDPGITAGFGLIFTGINLKDPRNSFLEVADQAHFKNKFADVLRFIKNNLFESKAQAFTLDPKLAKKLVKIAIVTGVALSAAVVLKYTLYKDFFKAKRAAEDLAGKPRNTFFKKATGQVADIGDTFAHVLTTIAQLAPVWFGNAVEFLGDRYAPKIMSGKNNLTRKFLEKFGPYFARSTMDRTPVNGKTWVYGSVIVGGIDTLCVYIQLYDVVPALGGFIGNNVPALAPRVTDAFGLDNPNIANLNMNGVAFNAAAYITTGASSFAQDLQAQLIEKIKGQVAEEMKNKNLDPFASENTGAFNQRVAQLLDLEMQRLGLPSQENFMFDAGSIWSSVQTLVGYNPPGYLINENRTKDNFLGTIRPGLIISSLQKSIHDLKKRAQIDPHDADLQTALKILEQTYDDVSALPAALSQLKLYIKNPQQAAGAGLAFTLIKAKIITAKSELVALTYEGYQEVSEEFLPKSWAGRVSPSAVHLAAQTFRNSFLNYLEGKKIAVKPFEGPKKGLIYKWQEKEILRKTQEAYAAQSGETFVLGLADPGHLAKWKALYSQKMAETMGLRPNYELLAGVKETGTTSPEDLEELILRTADGDSDAQLKDPRIVEYTTSLSPQEKLVFESQVRGQNFINQYVKTFWAGDRRSVLAPGQPGYFQKIRQTSYVKKSVVLTRTIRFMESAAPIDRYVLGRQGVLERRIPFWYDAKQSAWRTLRMALTSATAIYAFRYFVYDIDYPAALWTWTMLWNFSIGAPAQTINRMFGMQGWKTMGKLPIILLFGLIWTWSTFWGTLPEQIFTGDWVKYFNKAEEPFVEKYRELENRLDGLPAKFPNDSVTIKDKRGQNCIVTFENLSNSR